MEHGLAAKARSRERSIRRSSAIITTGYSARKNRVKMWEKTKRRRRKVISPLLCVAMAVYFEARGEQQIAGLIAVAEVIENRVQDSRFPDDHCSVVKQGRYWGGHPIKHQCQFTFYCDRKPETVRDHESWRTALLVASKALNGEFVPVTHGATHYHAKSVNPYWSHTGELTQAIGSHLFYKL